MKTRHLETLFALVKAYEDTIYATLDARERAEAQIVAQALLARDEWPGVLRAVRVREQRFAGDEWASLRARIRVVVANYIAGDSDHLSAYDAIMHLANVVPLDVAALETLALVADDYRQAETTLGLADT